MFSHQAIGQAMESEGYYREPKLIDFFKLEEMPIRDLDQNVEAGSKQAIRQLGPGSQLLCMDSQESQESGISNVVGPLVQLLQPLKSTSGAHSVQLQFRSGSCDSSRHIVGAGAVSTGVSRSSTSRNCNIKHLVAKPTEAAGQCVKALFARQAADVPKFNFLETPSLTKPTTTERESVTSSFDSDPQARQDSSEVGHSNISAGTIQSTDNSQVRPEEFELSHANGHDDMQLHKKQRFNAGVESGGCRWSSADIGKERPKMIEMKPLELENIEQVGTRVVTSSSRSSQYNSDPTEQTRLRIWQSDAGVNTGLEKDLIVEAATALVMLGLPNEPGKSQSSSSLAGLCLRPVSSSSTTDGRLAIDINAGEEIISFQGGEAARLANSEDATANSGLFRPSNKRRHRLISDLLAETLRISSDSENFN